MRVCQRQEPLEAQHPLHDLRGEAERREAPAPQLADAVRRVHLGLRVVDANLAAENLKYSETPLNADETDTLRAARDGGSVAVMAQELDVSERVVAAGADQQVRRVRRQVSELCAHVPRLAPVDGRQGCLRPEG